jgi:eukaryotic-like serine/threonine-protein kinase
VDVDSVLRIAGEACVQRAVGTANDVHGKHELIVRESLRFHIEGTPQARESYSQLSFRSRPHVGSPPILTSHLALTAGTRLGPYEIIAALGAGGMGEVYRARDTRLDRDVAIKFLLRDRVADPAMKHRFLQEARAASALNHPNIVVLHDIASHDGLDFLVMEHVAGKTLNDLIAPDGMPLDRVTKLGAQVASALAAAHVAGIVHRDIKPANIMVTADQVVKVLDFGIAKMVPGTAGPDGPTQAIATVTTPGVVVGTVSYMSPEQTRGEAIDARSDIFSLGCVLYQAATGQVPFRGASAMAIMHEIATVIPAAPSSLRPDLPGTFDALIARCLAKNPDQRFATMRTSRLRSDALRELLVEPWSTSARRSLRLPSCRSST